MTFGESSFAKVRARQLFWIAKFHAGFRQSESSNMMEKNFVGHTDVVLGHTGFSLGYYFRFRV